MWHSSYNLSLVPWRYWDQMGTGWHLWSVSPAACSPEVMLRNEALKCWAGAACWLGNALLIVWGTNGCHGQVLSILMIENTFFPSFWTCSALRRGSMHAAAGSARWLQTGRTQGCCWSAAASHKLCEASSFLLSSCPVVAKRKASGE